jgi:RNA polymerase sigma-70 factor (ECF subfamily)
MFRGFWGQIGSRLRIETDEELCGRAASDDDAAFGQLFDRYWNSIFRLTLAIVRNEAEAEDVAQTVFIELHRRAKDFDPAKGAFSNWLLRYAYTRAIDRKRYLASRGFYDQSDFSEFDSVNLAENSGLMFRLSANEQSHLIGQLLEHLNERQRFVVESYFFRGQSLQEIARQINETHGNTRHLLYRSLAKLRDVLQPPVIEDQVKERQTPDLNPAPKGVAIARARAL